METLEKILKDKHLLEKKQEEVKKLEGNLTKIESNLTESENLLKYNKLGLTKLDEEINILFIFKDAIEKNNFELLENITNVGTAKNILFNYLNIDINLKYDKKSIKEIFDLIKNKDDFRNYIIEKITFIKEDETREFYKKNIEKNEKSIENIQKIENLLKEQIEEIKNLIEDLKKIFEVKEEKKSLNKDTSNRTIVTAEKAMDVIETQQERKFKTMLADARTIRQFGLDNPNIFTRGEFINLTNNIKEALLYALEEKIPTLDPDNENTQQEVFNILYIALLDLKSNVDKDYLINLNLNSTLENIEKLNLTGKKYREFGRLYIDEIEGILVALRDNDNPLYQDIVNLKIILDNPDEFNDSDEIIKKYKKQTANAGINQALLEKDKTNGRLYLLDNFVEGEYNGLIGYQEND